MSFEPERVPMTGTTGADTILEMLRNTGKDPRPITHQFGLKIDELEIQFFHSFDGDTSEHWRVFRCPVKFNQSKTNAIYSREVFELPILSADKKTLKNT